MIPSLQFVNDSFSKFNALCFGGELPPVPVVLTHAGTFLGKIVFSGRKKLFGGFKGTFTMRISTAFDLPEKEWEDVVIHEMIHYYIGVKGIRDNSVHGDVFRQMMSDINGKFGRNITVRHRRIEGTPRPEDRVRANWICVTKLSGGQWGITVCAKTRIFEMHRTLPKFYRIEKAFWFGSTDTFFNRFPRSHTPKIYKTTREELLEHLKDAQPLECNGHSIYPVDIKVSKSQKIKW